MMIKRPQNLFIGKSCFQLYLKIVSTGVIIIFAIHFISNHATFNPDAPRFINDSITSSHKPSTTSTHISILHLNIAKSTRYGKNSSFVLALNYYEQLTCATRNLFALFMIAQNFDARVVIPFLWGSLFHGIPNDMIYDSTVKTHYYPLDTVYNIHKLNDSFHSVSGAYFVTFKDLIKTAPRDVVMIDTRHLPTKVTNDTAKFDCKEKKETNTVYSQLTKFTKYFNTKEFMLKMYMCIPPHMETTTDEIKRFIGPGPYTIIFTQWRGCSYHSCDIKAPRSFSNHFRHRILYHSVNKVSTFNLKNLPYNDTIKMTANKFLEKIKISTPYISVHIRTEKLAQTDAKVNGYTDCCLNLLGSLLELLKHKKPIINTTIAVTDVGEYGSTACRDKACLRHAEKVQNVLTSMGLTLVSFDPRVTGTIKSSAYVSLVEMNMLAMGDLLIVMGKGSFKQRIVNQFLQSNSINSVYYICTEHGNVLHDMNSLDKNCS